MEFIYDNGRIEKEKIIEQFGKEDFEEFYKYINNQEKPLTNEKEIRKGVMGIALISKGTHELWRLKEEHSRTQQTNLMIIAAFAAAASAFFSAYTNVWGQPEAQSLASNIMNFISALVGLGIGLLVLYIFYIIAQECYVFVKNKMSKKQTYK
jgi:hypothetical protein